MDGGAWRAAICGVTESQTQLNDENFITESLCCTSETNTTL